MALIERNLNSAFIAGASPIGTTLEINSTERIIEHGGEVWLRSGNIETDTDKYPHAPSPIGLEKLTYGESRFPLYMRIG